MANKLRPLEELINRDEPGWTLVQEWLAKALNPVEVLSRDAANAAECLHSMQVTTRSPLGAIIYESGGLLVDRGWLRILGSGAPRLPRRIDQWNWGRTVSGHGHSPPCVLIADDVIGGFFALNGGRFGAGNNVFYFAPDTLEWEDLEMGYSDFIWWALTGRLSGFYEDYRWQGWEQEVGLIAGDRVYSIAPPPFAAGVPFSQRSRAAVPIQEIWAMYVGNALLQEPGNSA